MPRRSTVDKREILPDPVYNSRLVTKFINNVTIQGKKSTAERLFYGALDLIGERTGDDPVKVFKRAVENAKPQVEVKSRRVGGSTYQVPIEVESGSPAGAGHPMADRLRQGASRKDHDAEARR